ncbi:uncharacterized protein [Venturia canescens]|uniref:uncharacterized protein n=1 Tax=Venturia canescens TaxID=32260 RepID=UPI001C9CA146|nr:uncharacterized protein LOC122412135 [Venturia canescens]
MACKTLCILGFIFFGFSRASARVFYVDGAANYAPNPLRTSYIYPLNYQPNEEPIEQSSRDLDMSFSAGDPLELPNDRGFLYPGMSRNVRPYPNRQEEPIIEVSRDYDRPASTHKLVDIPARRIIYGDQYPLLNRRVIRIDNNEGARKGEVVLELRVTANSKNDESI